MATWSGWQNQFLNRAGIIVTPPNRNLLASWAAHAATNCANNPIDLSHKLTGTSNCAVLTGIFPQAQRYTSHAQAATAFRDEIHASFASALLRAMNTGNPYQVSYSNDVASVFVSWGSPAMADAYLTGVAGPPGSKGGTGATGLHKGWTDLQRTLSKQRLGAKVVATNKMDAAALRQLKRARKVRIR